LISWVGVQITLLISRGVQKNRVTKKTEKTDGKLTEMTNRLNRLLKPEIFPVRFGFGFTTETGELNRSTHKINLKTT